MTRRALALAGLALMAILTGVGMATPAFAYWSSSGSGSGAATTATLDAPAGATAAINAGSSTVQVSWVGSPGLPTTAYYVTRINQSDGSTAPACGSSPTALIASPCTDAPGAGTFRYTVTAVLASWTATSVPSNSVTLALDTTAPRVTGVSSPQADGTYRTPGTVVPITVTFDERVAVTGSPTLTLVTGKPATTAIPYASGSGTAVLTFSYRIVDGNAAADLGYASSGALALNGGTVADAAGNSAVLTLPAPGGPGSLSFSKDLVVDTAPVVTVTSVNGNPVTFPYTVRSSVSSIGGTCGTEPGDSPEVSPLIDGAASSPPTAPCTAGTWTLTFPTKLSAEQILVLSATQTDLAGNTGTAPAQVLTIDRRRPGIELGAVAQAAPTAGRTADAAAMELAPADPVQGDTTATDTTPPAAVSIERRGPNEVVNSGPLEWTVTFSEPVGGVRGGTFDVVSGGIIGSPTIVAVAPIGSEPAEAWTVTVETGGLTGADSGSIRLDLGDVSGVADSAGHPLAPGALMGEAFTYDTTAPSVAVTGLDDPLGPEATIEVLGTAEPGDGPVTVHLCFGVAECDADSATEVPTTVTPAADGTWEATWSVKGRAGDWYAVAEQTDAAGNLGLSDVWGPYTN